MTKSPECDNGQHKGACSNQNECDCDCHVDLNEARRRLGENPPGPRVSNVT
jgi:hypothetical protein